MIAPLDHLDQVSIFGRSSVAFFLILALAGRFQPFTPMTNGEAKKRRSGAFSARLSGCGFPIGSGSCLSLCCRRLRCGLQAWPASADACTPLRMRTNTYWALAETRREAP
jgi:hypothetical protein